MSFHLLLLLIFAPNQLPKIDLIRLPHLLPLAIIQLYSIPAPTADDIQLYLRQQILLNLGLFQ